MTPLADRSTGEQWPELEPCACGGPFESGWWDEQECFYVQCIDLACSRHVRGELPTEAAAAWNAMQRVAKGLHPCDGSCMPASFYEALNSGDGVYRP